jgi:hypothetical protein
VSRTVRHHTLIRFKTSTQRSKLSFNKNLLKSITYIISLINFVPSNYNEDQYFVDIFTDFTDFINLYSIFGGVKMSQFGTSVTISPFIPVPNDNDDGCGESAR